MAKSTKAGRYEICRSKDKEFYWRFIKNGRIIAKSSETYKRKSACKRSVAIMMDSFYTDVVDKTKK